MRYSIWFIECDICKAHLDETSRELVTQVAAGFGWKRIREGRKVKDVCGDCAGEGCE